jgi:hypothetical protein
MAEEKNHLELLQEAQNLELTLKQLGVPIDKLDDILAYVDSYNSLMQDLQNARKTQFFNDAWVLMQVRGANKDSQTSAYLRTFAEHVVQMARDVFAQKPELSIDEIVDLIPPMEKQGPY